MAKKKLPEKEYRSSTVETSLTIKWPNAKQLMEPPDEDRDRIVNEDFDIDLPPYKAPLREKENKKI